MMGTAKINATLDEAHPAGLPVCVQDVDSSEVLTFRLAHPLCIVTELQLRPFKAYFQAVRQGRAVRALPFIHPRRCVFAWVACIASPPATDGSLRVDEVLCLAAACELSRSRQLQTGVQARPQDIAAMTASSHSQAALQLAAVCLNERCQQQEWTWESPAYATESQDVLQRFPIPPTLCVGGYLRVKLVGRQQRQAGNEAFYTCVSHLRALGTPLHNFQLQPPQLDDVEPRTGWQLTYKPFDPLLAAGGLATVAHRVQQAAGFEGVDASDSDSDYWGSDFDPQDGAEIIWDDSDPDGYDSLDDDRYD
ncbi:F-box protein [Chlorella vulgaris]